MQTLHAFIATPSIFEGVLLFISIIAGIVGSVLGLGGGIIIIPTLTLLFGVNIRYAIGASIVSIIATSSGAAATYVKDHITNVRVAMLLEVATTIGALCGAILAPYLNPRFLYLLFATVLAWSGYAMLQQGRKQDAGVSTKPPDPIATKLGLHSSYPDHALGREISYTVHHVVPSFILMLLAGVLSALLGIGSGVLKVPAMDRGMGLPIKVSSATSNFMIGVTAAASAGTFFMRGLILPSLAAPVALGVVIGSWIGVKLMARLPSRQIRRGFVVVIFIVCIQMILRGLGAQ